ncbi:hypothetical protein BD779DRAFT_1487745 [Infundibulicybe gibba]|nr:hypothetical protein BD779DRAFT_1487745 [Infundibulicybe gibba]
MKGRLELGLCGFFMSTSRSTMIVISHCHQKRLVNSNLGPRVISTTPNREHVIVFVIIKGRVDMRPRKGVSWGRRGDLKTSSWGVVIVDLALGTC